MRDPVDPSPAVTVTRRVDIAPCAVRHSTVESLPHVDASHVVAPRRDVAESENVVNPEPYTRVDVMPVVGWFPRSTFDTEAASYDTASVSSPNRTAAVAMTGYIVPTPRAIWQRTEDSEVHTDAWFGV